MDWFQTGKYFVCPKSHFYFIHLLVCCLFFIYTKKCCFCLTPHTPHIQSAHSEVKIVENRSNTVAKIALIKESTLGGRKET